jgi:hypothetical protein
MYFSTAPLETFPSDGDEQRFGLYNSCHKTKQLTSEQGEGQPKIVQGVLRHGKIQTTIDLYSPHAKRARTQGAIFLGQSVNQVSHGRRTQGGTAHPQHVPSSRF